MRVDVRPEDRAGRQDAGLVPDEEGDEKLEPVSFEGHLQIARNERLAVCRDLALAAPRHGR